MEDALVGVPAPIRIAFLEGVRNQILHCEDATQVLANTFAALAVVSSASPVSEQKALIPWKERERESTPLPCSDPPTSDLSFPIFAMVSQMWFLMGAWAVTSSHKSVVQYGNMGGPGTCLWTTDNHTTTCSTL